MSYGTVSRSLVSRGYLEEALSLAEKYRDFDILIEICEDLQDQDKLQHYMNLFNTEVRLGQIIFNEYYINLFFNSPL